MTDEKSVQIAALNDGFRSRCGIPIFGEQAVPGHFVSTRTIASLPPEAQIAIWARVPRRLSMSVAHKSQAGSF